MGKKILVVDDEEDIRELLSVLLEDHGYDVEKAENGEVCLKKLKDKEFDLVLMDMFMPGMSGRETTEKIRDNPKTKDTKVAFLTVAQFSAVGEEALKALGSVDYIKKPIDNDDFVARINKALA